MQALYSFGILLYTLAIRLAALANPKAREWVKGRKNWPQHLAATMEKRRPNQPTIWFHCASLGEFEQGRPVIEALKAQQPDLFILLTFFSPSGYLIRKNYAVADAVAYLPADTPGNARLFLDIAKPDRAVFVKYEFWFNLLGQLRHRRIPTILISARFRQEQVFFKPYGAWFRSFLHGFDHIFAQDEASAALLAQQRIKTVTVAGDTRVDRVVNIPEEGRAFPLIETFKGGAPVLIAGSTWPPDESLLAGLIRNALPDNWKVIIAPHDIQAAHLAQLEKGLPCPALRYSSLTPEKPSTSRILIIDNIGMLSNLYRYGDIAYIGGGFGAGIHNILEPMAFGLPVMFGPKFRKFEEAVWVAQHGGGRPIQDAGSLQEAFIQLSEATTHAAASATVRQYLATNKGATKKILNYLMKSSWQQPIENGLS